MMSDEINYKNNPLHGVGLKQLLVELTEQYGFKLLYAYLNINCFKTNPSIASSVKFLKKTDWARERVENFYLYSYKSLPRASHAQFQLSPRDRIVPEGQTVGPPAELSLEDAEQLREKRERKAAEYDANSGSEPRRSGRDDNQVRSHRSNSRSNNRDNRSSDKKGLNPWGNPWGTPSQ